MIRPCEQCIVKVMCQEPCDQIKIYADERVKELMLPVKVEYCTPEFLENTGWKMRNQPSKNTTVSYNQKLYNMIIQDGDIIEITRRDMMVA